MILHGIRRLVLRAFGAAQRPLAWTVAIGGSATLIGVILKLIAQTEPRLTLILVSADFALGGILAVMEVENELDSEASADDV